MNQKSLSLAGGLIVLALTLGGFFWLWTGFNKQALSRVQVSTNLEPIEIESIKSKAKQILEGLENNASIPIPVPIEKMGKENPFN